MYCVSSLADHVKRRYHRDGQRLEIWLLELPWVGVPSCSCLKRFASQEIGPVAAEVGCSGPTRAKKDGGLIFTGIVLSEPPCESSAYGSPSHQKNPHGLLRDSISTIGQERSVQSGRRIQRIRHKQSLKLGIINNKDNPKTSRAT